MSVIKKLAGARVAVSVLIGLMMLMVGGVNAQDTANTLVFDTTAWNYDATNDVYWQIGVVYVSNPETTEYESLGIFVPGAYMTATDNGNGTYTASVNLEGTVNGYTAETAPIVMPIHTPGYSASSAPTAYSYDSVASYVSAGFIYLHAGARGKSNGYDGNGNLTFSAGAPWGVTDFKAAIRYYRYNQAVLAGDTNHIFVFGVSGGGAQSSLLGASGDSQLYFPYLESIGAAMTDADGNYISDAIAGVMAWVPITSLDYANAAYEWNMGQYASTNTRADTTWTSALSDDLAEAYAMYINELGLTDEAGNVLTLEASETGIYASGSYYDYLLGIVEESLNNFLADTTFPYTQAPAMRGGMRGGTPPQGGQLPQGTPPQGMPAQTEAVTYETVDAYFAALNATVQWVTYDATTNTATITSIADFVAYGAKAPTKNVGAFDDLARGQAENDVFGNDASDALHFDFGLAELLVTNQADYATFADWDASLIEAYQTDLQALDKLGNGIQHRQNMYNPMYYLLPYYEGYQTATVAPYWRVNSGIEQGDTALTVEVNLMLALNSYEGVESVDFSTVWDQGHVSAERTGDGTTNFIAWVNSVVNQ